MYLPFGYLRFAVFVTGGQWRHLLYFITFLSNCTYGESSAAINAYYILYQNGVIMNKDFCPRLQSNPSNPFVDKSKEIILEFDNHISSPFALQDECGFAFKRLSTGQYELMHLISTFLTTGKDAMGQFPSSTSCQEHITFQWRALRKSVIPAAFCSSYKNSGPINVNTQQRRFDPLLWFNPVNQLGLYFKQPWKKSTSNITAHLVFRLLSADGCEFRIQHYRIEPNCSTLDQVGYLSPVANCEIIGCNQEQELLQWIQEASWNLDAIHAPAKNLSIEDDKTVWWTEEDPNFRFTTTISPVIPFLTVVSWGFLLYWCRLKWKQKRSSIVDRQSIPMTYTDEFVSSAILAAYPGPSYSPILLNPNTNRSRPGTEPQKVEDEPPMYESLQRMDSTEFLPTYEEAIYMQTHAYTR